MLKHFLSENDIKCDKKIVKWQKKFNNVKSDVQYVVIYLDPIFYST